MDIAEEIKKLEDLRKSGSLSEEEFAKAKAAILAGEAPGGAKPAGGGGDLTAKQWTMFLHLSLLAGFLVPFAGLIAPIVIWQLKKAQFPEVDVHGKNVVNWIISAVIYGVGGFILSFLIIGIPILIALAVVSIVFPIIGAVKANNGEVWKYPLTITFIK